MASRRLHTHPACELLGTAPVQVTGGYYLVGGDVWAWCETLFTHRQGILERFNLSRSQRSVQCLALLSEDDRSLLLALVVLLVLAGAHREVARTTRQTTEFL